MATAAAAARRTIVITGASSGIGAELARVLDRTGKYAFILAARREPELKAVAAGLTSPSVTVIADVTKKTDVERILEQAIANFGGCDVWVNNAGQGIVKSVLELTDEDMDEMYSINVKSVLYGMQVAVKHFREARDNRGHVLNVSSMLGKIPAATVRSAYCAAKAAVNSLSSSLRIELLGMKLTDIHITTLIPGVVFTEFASRAKHSGGGLPTGIPGQPVDEVANIFAEAVQTSEPDSGKTVPVEVYTQGTRQHEAAIRYFTDLGAMEAELAARRQMSV